MDPRHVSAMRSLLLLLALAALVVAGTASYVAGERTVSFWDEAAYQDMAQAQVVAVRELRASVPAGLRQWLVAVWRSTGRDHSTLFTLPLVPSIFLFGGSRLTYVLSLALVYLPPYALVVGALAAALAPSAGGRVSWPAAFFSLLVPATWLPTLRGYPDTGAAALVGLAAVFYLRDDRLARPWQLGLIGTLLALAVLFRRHFAYAGTAIFAALALHAAAVSLVAAAGAWSGAASPWVAARALGHRAGRIGLLGLCTAAAMVLLGWPFVERALGTDFGALYASYQEPAALTLLYFLSYYGGLACGLAALGFALGLRTGTLSWRPTLFVLLFGIISLLQWTVYVRQLGDQYTLHFDVPVVLGLVALVRTIERVGAPRTRRLLLAGCSTYLVLNLAIGVSPLGGALTRAPSGVAAAARGLFAFPYPPQRREDAGELARLAKYLQSQAAPLDPIYVASSSEILNSDLLWHAARALFDEPLSHATSDFWRGRGVNVLQWVPFVDSADAYPLEMLMYAQYVVVVRPVQYHLRPEEQAVVRVAVAAIAEDWAFGQDFTPLPQRFRLTGVGGGGTGLLQRLRWVWPPAVEPLPARFEASAAGAAEVEVYRRVRPTALATAMQTLEAMQRAVGRRPGGQLSWLGLNAAPGAYVVRSSIDGVDGYGMGNSLGGAWDDRPPAPAAVFLYLEPPPPVVLVTGQLSPGDAGCPEVSISVQGIDRSGEVVGERSLRRRVADGAAVALATPTAGAAHLLLTVTGHGPGGCSWHLARLRVTPQA